MAGAEQVEKGSRLENRHIAFLMRLQVAKDGGEVSEAHSPTHLRNTARLTQLVGSIYGFTPQEAKLAYFAGVFHDIVRSPGEDPNSTDEVRSASLAQDQLVAMNDRGIIVASDEEREAVAFAIENHGTKPAYFLDPNTREDTPQSLPDRIHTALFVADKLEANGARVIARRSSFVAGERLHRSDGDLQEFGFRPDRHEFLVVAVESLIRLAYVNPQEMYPRKLRLVVNPLYDVQREFVAGVLANNPDYGSMLKMAELLLRTRRKDGKNLLEARGISAPNDVRTLALDLDEKTGLDTTYLGLDPQDVRNSSGEAVQYFSSQYKENLDNLIDEWKPKGRASKRWRRLMLEYSSGKWFNQVAEEIRIDSNLAPEMRGLVDAIGPLDRLFGTFAKDMMREMFHPDEE